MPEVPRRLPITEEERMQTHAKSVSSSSSVGITRYARPLAENKDQNKEHFVTVWIQTDEPLTAQVGDFWAEP